MQLFFRVFLFGCVCVCVVLLVKRNLNTPPLFQNPGSATHAKSPVFTRLTAAYAAALIRVNGMSTQNGIQFYVHQALKKKLFTSGVIRSMYTTKHISQNSDVEQLFDICFSENNTF